MYTANGEIRLSLIAKHKVVTKYLEKFGGHGEEVDTKDTFMRLFCRK